MTKTFYCIVMTLKSQSQDLPQAADQTHQTAETVAAVITNMFPNRETGEQT